jgi:hypothetical protein
MAAASATTSKSTVVQANPTAQAQLGQNPAQSAAAASTSKVFLNYLNIKGPTGENIPVESPTFMDYYKEGTGYTRSGVEGSVFDSKDRIVLCDCESVNLGRIPAYSKYDGHTYRAVDGFDYVPFGLQKIGNIWVVAKNQKAVQNATQISKSSTCVIS